VTEYLIWRINDCRFEWNVLRGSHYEHIQTREDGVLCSEVFPGLWLDTQAMLTGNLAKVLRVLQQGLGSPEHAEWIANRT